MYKSFPSCVKVLTAVQPTSFPPWARPQATRAVSKSALSRFSILGKRRVASVVEVSAAVEGAILASFLDARCVTPGRPWHGPEAFGRTAGSSWGWSLELLTKEHDDGSKRIPRFGRGTQSIGVQQYGMVDVSDGVFMSQSCQPHCHCIHCVVCDRDLSRFYCCCQY
jgi:hypothetical protein